MQKTMNREPEFLIDKENEVIVELIAGDMEKLMMDKAGGNSLCRLIPNVSEGASEKHLPVIERNGSHVIVKVGSVFHPMSEEHSIAWVCLVTEAGCVQRICLTPDCEPVAEFVLPEGDAPKAAYAYCNLHGFWKTEI